ncbi:MFS transporter [Microbacterium sp. KSW2-21]|uniref:MFS transporter n=1 Tax=Microbacterium algihabitans TaxID=3075992 RepID=A0ABU3S0X2_9MICO|nr:MFS transporter [Microbacterium sp. KSW2-21]MDU0328445.1 MFS transporter [Microbacterium sp. KSW2-21]
MTIPQNPHSDGVPPITDPRSPAQAETLAATISAEEGTAQQLPKMRPGLVFLLTLGVFGVYLAFVTPIAISLAIRVNFLAPENPEYLGVVLSLGSIAGLITGPFGGMLSDRTRSRFGRRRPWLVGATILGLAGLALMAAIPSIVVLTLGWIIAAAGLNLAANTFLTIQADRLPESQRGKVAAITGFATMVAPVIGAVLGGIVQNQPYVLFLLPGAIALIFVLIFTIAYKDADSRSLTFTEKLTVGSVLSKYVFNPKRYQDYGWNWLGRFLFFFGLTLSTSYTAYFFSSRLDVPVEEIGGVVATVGGVGILATVLGVFAGGFLSDKIKRRKPFVLGAGLLFAAGSIVTLSASDLTLLLVGALLCNISIGVFSAVDQALVLDVLPERETDAARYINIIQLANGIPQAVAPLAAAGLLSIAAAGEDKPYWLLYALAAVFTIASGFVVLRVKAVR